MPSTQRSTRGGPAVHRGGPAQPNPYVLRCWFTSARPCCTNTRDVCDPRPSLLRSTGTSLNSDMLRSTATYITPVGFIGRPRLGDTCTAPYYQSRMYSRTFPGDRGGEPPPLRRRRANTDAGRIGARTEEEINFPLSHGRNALSPVGRDRPWECRVVKASFGIHGPCPAASGCQSGPAKNPAHERRRRRPLRSRIRMDGRGTWQAKAQQGPGHMARGAPALRAMGGRRFCC